jgi:hypothetical protein
MQWHELRPTERLKLVRQQLWTLPRNPRLFLSLAAVIVTAVILDIRLDDPWGTASMVSSIFIVVFIFRRDAEARGLVDRPPRPEGTDGSPR